MSKVSLCYNLTCERIIDALDSDSELNIVNNLRWPYSICNKNVTQRMKGIKCDTCDKWSHIKCNGISSEEYDYFIKTDDVGFSVDWHCLYCTIKINKENFAFTLIDDSEINKINTCNSMRFCEYLPSFDRIDEADKLFRFQPQSADSDDFDDNIPSLLNTKYYSVNAFQQLNNFNNLNVFHSNVNGLESKFDALHDFLVNTKAGFDIVAIAETSEQSENSFLSNISIEGKTLFHTPTNSNKGGVAIYINSEYKPFERFDLKFQDDTFESVWTEISNKSSKNVLCGCIYRHPSYDMSEFLIYMESVLKTIASEDKEIYICGDFNIDLLKLNNTDYLKFYNLLCCYEFLPLIIHPTRVVENQEPSVIDNIYSNNLCDEIISGNIYFNLSEHFSQFASIKRGKLDTKSANVYTRDFNKYSAQKFRDDLSIQNWNMSNSDSSILFNDFFIKLKGSADRHAPFKKLSRRELSFRSKPWISPDLAKMIKIKNNLFERRKRQPTNDDIKVLYNKFRNRVNRELKKSRKSYYTDYFNKHNHNIKKTWEGIRSIVNVKKNSNQDLSQLNINGKLVEEPEKLANHINDLFVNVGPELDEKIPTVTHITADKYLKNRNQINFFIAQKNC